MAIGMVATGADLVRERDVGVQVRVPGTGVAVLEGSGEEPGGLDLLLPAVTDPGQCGLRLQPAEGVGQRLVMGLLHRLPGRGRASAHNSDADFTGVNTRS